LSAKQLLKAQERFKAALNEFVVSKGARPGQFYNYELDTPAGILHLSVYDDWIACRFDDVARGRVATEACGSSCNPYSGKWNFHFSEGTAPDAVIAHFGYFLGRLLSLQPVAV